MRLKIITIALMLLFLIPLASGVEPVVTLSSPADSTITNETSQNFQCSATDDSALANMTLFHNLSGTFTAISTQLLSGMSDSASFADTIPFNGTIIWNCEAFDTIGNRAFASANFTLAINQTFPAFFVELESPANDTLDTDGLVTFVYETNRVGNASLILNNVTNQSMASAVGINSFPQLAFTTNETITWEVNVTTEIEAITSEERILIINATSITPLEPFFSVTECKATTAGFLGLGLFVLISLVFIILGITTKIGVLGFFGSLLLLLSSMLLIPCSFIFGEAMVLFSVLLMFMFIFRSFFPTTTGS